MYFESFNEFLAMGKHGLYVWLSYGAFILIVGWILFNAFSGRKKSVSNARKSWMRDSLSQEHNK